MQSENLKFIKPNCSITYAKINFKTYFKISLLTKIPWCTYYLRFIENKNIPFYMWGKSEFLNKPLYDNGKARGPTAKTSHISSNVSTCVKLKFTSITNKFCLLYTLSFWLYRVLKLILSCQTSTALFQATCACSDVSSFL
jgi:hypothetical protein